MSKKTSLNPTLLAVAAVGIMIVVLVAATLMYEMNSGQPQVVDTSEEAARRAALASEQAPTIGEPGATVHLVEFLDPACETCAVFYPMVKQWMAQVPGQIRLSIRHVAFHEGAEYAVRVLEASRNQGKYWETLELLLKTQRQWTEHHRVLPERIRPIITELDIDMIKLEADMNSAEVTQRIERDKQDAILLKVSKTPDYFVNGRPLPSFGRQQLADLIREELRK